MATVAAHLGVVLKDPFKSRGYGLGERNPATLPNLTKDHESEVKNAERTEHWAYVRKLAETDRLPRKYAH